MSIRINVGCGQDVRMGFLNIDLVQAHNSVVCQDFRNISSLATDGSAEEIVANSVVEYLAAAEMPAVLAHWIGKLKTGGKLFLSTVDSQYLANKIVHNNIDLININKILYEGRLGLYDMPNICNVLESNGMTLLRKYYDPNSCKLFIEAVKD